MSMTTSYDGKDWRKGDPLPDLSIHGVNTAAGGSYQHVEIHGVGRIGSDLTSESFEAHGHVRLGGDLRTEELSSHGHLSIQGDLLAATGSLDGMATVRGRVRGEQLELNGMLTVHGDCEVEQLKVNGNLEVRGLLSAGTLDIQLHGSSKAAEIGVESIRVRKLPRSKWHALWSWAIPKLNPELEAHTIEGDEIELTLTTAQYVRGNRVVIGPGCVIGRVEYRDELIKAPDAWIREEVKLGD
ncbi:hypothetical protein ACFO9Q_15525 [Paenibacillus sp. GCM10023252]|uniref:hypothetical protein n=1 Tax=Paenibacillus sp. GCM10023252 TaxID=3252649 RepID=UPI003608E869